MVLLAPGMGDGIQAAKAGILEVGDLYVVNKADRDGADRLRRDLASLTADGRLSSQVLLGLPVVTLLGVSVLSPGYATPLVATSAGRAFLLLTNS